MMLETEIARAVRYGTDLCGIAFSVYKTATAAPGQGGDVSSIDVTTEILKKLREKLRNTDWIGVLSNKLFMAVLPMTTAKEAHLATRRLLKALNAEPVHIAGRPVPVKIAGSVIHYDRKRMPDTDALIQYAQNEHMEMAHRLRNLQDFM
jgi:GGDEF domain-containing protein